MYANDFLTKKGLLAEKDYDIILKQLYQGDVTSWNGKQGKKVTIGNKNFFVGSDKSNPFGSNYGTTVVWDTSTGKSLGSFASSPDSITFGRNILNSMGYKGEYFGMTPKEREVKAFDLGFKGESIYDDKRGLQPSGKSYMNPAAPQYGQVIMPRSYGEEQKFINSGWQVTDKPEAAATGWQTPAQQQQAPQTGGLGIAATEKKLNIEDTVNMAPTAPATTQKATLTSPDGKYKVAVNVGSSEASQLQSKGWKVGATGKSVIDLAKALQQVGSSPSTLVPPVTAPATTSEPKTPTKKTPEQAAPILTQTELNPGDYIDGPRWEELRQIYTDPKQLESLITRKNGVIYWKGEEAAQKEQQQMQPPSGYIPPEEAGSYNYNIDGDYALVKFSDDPNGAAEGDASTVWLFDKNNKTYRPFKSMKAMEAVFGDSLNDALNNIVTLPTTALNTDVFSGNFLSTSTEAFLDSGSTPEGKTLTTLISGAEAEKNTTNSLMQIYGQTKQDPSIEQWVGQFIGTALTQAKTKGDISEKVFNETLLNPTQLAKYTNAMLYGGYTLDDIYRDIKAKELVAQGKTEYANMKAFDEAISANAWYATEEGKKAKGDALLTPDASFLAQDPDLYKYSIFQIPGKAFTTLVEPIDMNSPEFKAEAEKIAASFYDISMQKAEATTQQERALAETNWKEYKSNLEKQYGIQLSDNVNAAWNQVQQIFSGASQRGIYGSGIMNEATDRYLSDVRKGDNLLRESLATKEETEYRSYLLTSGTPAEIAKFALDNPEKAKAWGLIPSDEMKNWFTKENFKSLYPDMSDDEITATLNTIVDENGNYRSSLYQNLYSNKYGLGEQKKTYQEGKLYEQKAQEEEKAYAPFTKDNPFLNYAEDQSTLYDTPASSSVPATATPTVGTVKMVKVQNPNTGLELEMTPDAAQNYINKNEGWSISTGTTAGTTAAQKAAGTIGKIMTDVVKPSAPSTPTSSSTTSAGVYIPNTDALVARQKELTGLGIQAKDWGKYISAPGADKKLYYTAPTSPAPAAQKAPKKVNTETTTATKKNIYSKNTTLSSAQKNAAILNKLTK
jgi:hypothetical protein